MTWNPLGLFVLAGSAVMIGCLLLLVCEAAQENPRPARALIPAGIAAFALVAMMVAALQP